MNKSLVTNLLAVSILILGYLLPNELIKTVGLFAVSGAVTNWLAIHMLFEKVPGLYGSGVVPLHFDEFRRGIRELMMQQFFTNENINRFVSNQSGGRVDLKPVIHSMDLTPTFDGLVQTIEESSFGAMLAMIGGAEGLNVLRDPFIKKMKQSLETIADSEQVQQAITNSLENPQSLDGLRQRITEIIEKRLGELTPDMVKRIIQEMIRKHLGWLVVWGGVFGGLIGYLSTLVK